MADKSNITQYETTIEARKRKEQKSYKELAATYGIAMILFAVNSIIIPYFYAMVIGLIGTMTNMTAMTDEMYILILLGNSVLSYAFPFAFVFVLFSRLSAEAPLDFNYKKLPFELPLMFCVSLTLGSTATIITRLISYIVDNFFSTGVPEDAFSNTSPQTIPQFIIFFICIGIIAPICEEVIFRWFLLAPMRKYGDLAACFISALIFALYHGNLDQFPYALAVGFIYGVVACRTNKILPTIIFHAINNISLLFMSYLPPREAFGNDAIYDIFNMTGVVITILFDVLMAAGIIVFVILIVKKVFKLSSHSQFLTNGEKWKKFVLNPAVIIGTGLMIVAFLV